ncbi:MAG: BrnT family toxin [Pseudomonadota bacterium]
MHVEFDPTKAAANLKKHGIAFSDAELVLYDPMALTNEDDATHDEARFVTVAWVRKIGC